MILVTRCHSNVAHGSSIDAQEERRLTMISTEVNECRSFSQRTITLDDAIAHVQNFGAQKYPYLRKIKVTMLTSVDASMAISLTAIGS